MALGYYFYQPLQHWGLAPATGRILARYTQKSALDVLRFSHKRKSEFCGEHVLVSRQKEQRAWNSDVFCWCFANPLSIKPSTDMEPDGNFLCIRSWAGIKVCFLPFSTEWVMILHQAHLGALFRKATALIRMLLAPRLYYCCFTCVKLQHVWVGLVNGHREVSSLLSCEMVLRPVYKRHCWHF